MVVASTDLANIEQLRFFNPTFFRVGDIHNRLPVWETLLSGHSSSQANFFDIVQEGVQPFKGNFKGRSYDAPRPPSIRLSNSKICEGFRDFISETLLDWVAAGVVDVWGRVGEVTPPHLVLPLTVEPSKPRLCHDERYLNLWIRDPPSGLIIFPTCSDMFSLGIFRRLLTIRAATNMCAFIPRHVPILVLNGMMCISYFVPYRLAGRRVPLFIITWAYSLLVQLVRLVFLCRSTSMIVMLVSFFVLLLVPV